MIFFFIMGMEPRASLYHQATSPAPVNDVWHRGQDHVPKKGQSLPEMVLGRLHIHYKGMKSDPDTKSTDSRGLSEQNKARIKECLWGCGEVEPRELAAGFVK
jgi:hypothetical protein